MENPKDNEKFFDKTNYITAHIHLEQQDQKKKERVTTLLELLTQQANREVKEDVLKMLKEGSGGLELLTSAISEFKDNPYKYILVAACWEANIDASAHLSFFTDLALNDNYQVCLESLTVIENMEEPVDKKEIQQNQDKITNWLSTNPAAEKRILIESLQEILGNLKIADK